ncbi:hypothetical protein BS50DRAFT_249833 [Corynespora cassiicola Philippines]|uniref:Uncharacterized protein n=1 Tax=Corynespora cassiicola Philippines TaxID=1448308 RepID=A0A2T2P3U4_CORCC|nr:hypothetical protein BS50DRAFT_249833 [Corynespora cassiicola Philippines]
MHSQPPSPGAPTLQIRRHPRRTLSPLWTQKNPPPKHRPNLPPSPSNREKHVGTHVPSGSSACAPTCPHVHTHARTHARCWICSAQHACPPTDLSIRMRDEAPQCSAVQCTTAHLPCHALPHRMILFCM